MSTLRRPRPLATTTAAIVLVALVAGGCSDDDSPSEADPTSPSATSSGSDPAPDPTSEPATDPTTDPTSDPTSEPAGATGPELALESLSVRAPEGWKKVPSETPFDVAARGGEGVRGNQVLLVSFPMIVGGSTLDEIATAALERSRPRAKILEPVLVGGVEMAHVRGYYGSVLTDKYVADVGGDQVSIDFGYDDEVENDRAFQQALMDEVLATAEWSG